MTDYTSLVTVVVRQSIVDRRILDEILIRRLSLTIAESREDLVERFLNDRDIFVLYVRTVLYRRVNSGRFSGNSKYFQRTVLRVNVLYTLLLLSRNSVVNVQLFVDMFDISIAIVDYQFFLSDKVELLSMTQFHSSEIRRER